MNPKQFYKRWKQGMRELTVTQQLNAKKNGHLGCVIGLSIAILGFAYKLIMIRFDWVQLGFAIFIFFLVWLQWHEYVGTKQKHKATMEIMEEIQGQELLNEL